MRFLFCLCCTGSCDCMEQYQWGHLHSDEKSLWKAKAKVYLCAIESNVYMRGRKAHTTHKHIANAWTCRLQFLPQGVQIRINLLPACGSQPDYISPCPTSQAERSAVPWAMLSPVRHGLPRLLPKSQAAPQIPGWAGGRGQSLLLGRGRVYPWFSGTVRTR